MKCDPSIKCCFHFKFLLLDIEKAFDCVWHKALIFKLCNHAYPTFLIKLVQSFLNSRESFVSVGENHSTPYSIPAGVPQGSLLSPHLFNIFINDIPKPKNCKVAIYADDTALYTKVPIYLDDVYLVTAFVPSLTCLANSPGNNIIIVFYFHEYFYFFSCFFCNITVVV